MNLRLIIDQSHDEFLNVTNTEILQSLLVELNYIVFPLTDRPITLGKLHDGQILFIGCPSIPFEATEIYSIIKFVEMGNFLILISGSGGDYANNSNINEISRYFEFEFNPDYVEDDKHNYNFSRIPIIYKFKKNPIFKRIKKLVYTGCSISILDSSISPLMKTDSDSIPVNSPIMIISENHLIFGIGGYSIFSDDPVYGIRTMDNLRFVYNLFELIKSRYSKKKGRFKKESSIKTKKVTLKNVKKDFLKLLSSNIQKMNDLSEKIDIYWTECSDLIFTQQIDRAKKLASSEYLQILQTIDVMATQIGNSFNEYNILFPKFKKFIQNEFNQWFEIEAEIRAKLDMIRNNIILKLKQV
ncbi:MAG: hypothetical protein ACFFD2_09425 [Promethearchaeota archaeon]